MNKTALITGASTGIGYELSKLFAQDHHDVVLVARNEKKLKLVAKELETSYGISAMVLSADLARPESPEYIYETLQKKAVPIDYLVNNAGFGLGGPFDETNINTELEMIQVNVTSLVHLTKLFLLDMRQRGSGKILNVASTAAFQPGPLMAIYFATKAFVLSFSEAIANELDGTGITVTAVCPGLTATEFQQRAHVQETRIVKSKAFGFMKAREVAEIGYRGFLKGERLVIPGLLNKISVQSVRLAPRSVVTQIARWFQAK